MPVLFEVLRDSRLTAPTSLSTPPRRGGFWRHAAPSSSGTAASAALPSGRFGFPDFFLGWGIAHLAPGPPSNVLLAQRRPPQLIVSPHVVSRALGSSHSLEGQRLLRRRHIADPLAPGWQRVPQLFIQPAAPRKRFEQPLGRAETSAPHRSSEAAPDFCIPSLATWGAGAVCRRLRSWRAVSD